MTFISTYIDRKFRCKHLALDMGSTSSEDYKDSNRRISSAIARIRSVTAFTSFIIVFIAHTSFPLQYSEDIFSGKLTLKGYFPIVILA